MQLGKPNASNVLRVRVPRTRESTWWPKLNDTTLHFLF